MPLPKGDKFFARVRAADLSCPACGQIILFGPGRKGGPYDQKTARLTCPACNKTYIVGLLLYPAKKGKHYLPGDQIPTQRQALAIREQIGGMWVEEEEALGGQPERTNRVEED